MFLSACLYAGVHLYVVPFETSKKALVELSFPILSEVAIYVYDNDDNLVRHENIEKGSVYKRIYDFSELERGYYTIISDSKDLKVTKIIQVNTQSIEVVSTEYFYRPVFTMQGDILHIEYKNPDQSDVKISIEDSEDIYYMENLQGDELFKKSFNIQQLSRGEYTVRFEVNGYRFAYYIRKDL